MKSLSSYLNESVISTIKKECSMNHYPRVSFENAMQFLLTDGILPKSNLPVRSFLKLEDWIRKQGEPAVFTTTELKNKTGTILNLVMRGTTIKLLKHGKPVAELRPLSKI